MHKEKMLLCFFKTFRNYILNTMYIRSKVINNIRYYTQN